MQTNEFHNLQIKDSLDKEIELIKFENFDELWEKLTTESDKKNESDFYISKKILSEKIEKNSNTFYKAKFNRSLNTHFKKDLDDETAGKIAIISDCIAKQYQVDGIKFKSRIEFVSLFHKSRESFDYLKEKNIDIFGGTRNIFLPFDYEFFDTRIQKNNFVNILVCYRNFNFLNFGVKEKNIITIDETIKDDRDLYTEAEATVNRFLKNSSII